MFDLVAAKLHDPLLRPGTVRRSSLIERLARGDRRPIAGWALYLHDGKPANCHNLLSLQWRRGADAAIAVMGGGTATWRDPDRRISRCARLPALAAWIAVIG